MKITEVVMHAVDPGDFAYAGTPVTWLFVEIRTDEGLVGFGECTNWPGCGNSLVSRAVELVSEALIGRDPSRIEQIWVELFRRFTYLGSRGLVTAVISGIDIALWDLKGKALGRPIYDLLGGGVRDAVPLYTHPGGDTPHDAADNALRLMTDGFAAFKFDPFAEMQRYHTAYLGGEISKAAVRVGAEWIATIRDAVGPDVELLVDLHGNYNVASALRCIQALRDFDITWFEEPFPPENVDALRQLQAQTSAPLCVGERLYTRWDFLPIFRDRLANFVMPDVCWTGGISELKKISTMAEAHAVPMAPHGALGPLQTVAGAHVVLGVPNLYRLEVLGPDWLTLYGACLGDALDIRDGRLWLTDRPGLGVEPDPDFLRNYPATLP